MFQGLEGRPDVLYPQSEISLLAHKDILTSPISNLPDDVLRYIFSDPGLGSSVIQVCDPKAFVRTVISVSKRWRTLALSSPELWTRICVEFPKGASDQMKAMVGPFIRNCLYLSAEMPILVLEIDTLCTPQLLGIDCVNSLIESAPRWINVSIMDQDLLTKIAPRLLMPIIKEFHISNIAKRALSFYATPQLEHLSLGDIDYSSSRITFHSLPSLRSLDMIDIRKPFRICDNIPWSQLTELSVVSFAVSSSRELHLMLSNVPNLKRLEIWESFNIRRPVTLPFLEVLELNKTYTELLDVLTAPCLKRIQCRDVGPWLLRSLAGFTRRSKCTVNELDFEDVSLDDPWEIHELDELKSLRLDYSEDSHVGAKQSALQLLVQDDDGNTLFPRLETFKMFTEAQPSDDEVADLIQMLKSRLRGRSGDINQYLKSVDVCFFKGMSPEGKKNLKEFLQSDLVRGSGVQFSISYYGLSRQRDNVHIRQFHITV